MTNDIKLEQYQEIIDKLYSSQKLTNEEKTIVESDTAFQEYQKEFGLIEKAISHNVLEQKLSEMNKLEEKYKGEVGSKIPQKPRLSRRSYLLLASSFILLLVAYYLYSSNLGDDSYDGDLLAADYVMDFPDPDNTRSTNNNIDNQLSKDPYKLYSDANDDGTSYGKASMAFKNLIQSDDNPKHKFYLGISLLRESKWKEAEEIFGDNQLKELNNYPINYYLAVAKIGLEKTEEAIELLNTPTTGNTFYNKEAQVIIKKLERMRNRKK